MMTSAGFKLFVRLGDCVGGKRVDDLLPLRRPGLLQQTERPQRPGCAGTVEDLVEKELALRGLELPGIAAVFAEQEAVVGSDPAAIGTVEADGGQPTGDRNLPGFPGGAAIPGAEQLSGEAGNPAVFRVQEDNRTERPGGTGDLHLPPGLAAVQRVQDGAREAGRPDG